MSGIAGIIHFDGAPVAPGLIEKMTSAMAHRGPDGIQHWVKGSVALGQCMLCTTPESLEENQPLANEDKSLVLVMDGRVDNWEELRRELLGRRVVLRDRSDAELVLRAYEVWGEDCPDRIIGELAFFIWDARRRCLFGARDAAGTRHFYYHWETGRILFASEIKGILATELVAPRLNDSRVLDFLVPEYDRDDQIGTFYRDILRLPAGHAIAVGAHGVKTWRYWSPENLPTLQFASMEDCAQAFLECLRDSVKCRLRGDGNLGAMLSGGLDSSSIVGLIRKEFREMLIDPLQTYSVVREDRENCLDWRHIEEMLAMGWVTPVVLDTAVAATGRPTCLHDSAGLDEPFAITHSLTYALVYEAAGANGCRVVLDGMAGDLLFYGLERSLDLVIRERMYARLPEIAQAYKIHGVPNLPLRAVVRTAAIVAPSMLRRYARGLRRRRESGQPELALLRPEYAKPWLAEKRRQRDGERLVLRNLQQRPSHSQHFTSGLLSFPHEVYGQIAFACGVEPRSPFSDRRMVEFAIQAPTWAKLSAPWYKHLLRLASADFLPRAVTWRSDLGSHPGWKAYQCLIAAKMGGEAGLMEKKRVTERLAGWINIGKFYSDWETYRQTMDYDVGRRLFTVVALAEWIETSSV